jgi:lipopolysaccharide/colanic/teichoic acid biosynthesis glycosyltransferase
MVISDNQKFGMPRWKRMLDVIIILLTLPVVLPVAAIIALVIRRFSSGPILFMQERVGYRGERFMCLKFRTMHCGAETVSHQGHLKDLMQSNAPMTKMDNRGDSRIIPFGKILRCSGLDELPQLFNVLQGEMSLVGPRPCLPYEAQQYQEWQRERFNGVPGLTGLWQVSGKNRTTFTKMIQLDIEYTRRKSLWLDLRIIAMTIPALLIQMWDMSRQKRLQRRQQHKVESPVTTAAPLTARATNN